MKQLNGGLSIVVCSLVLACADVAPTETVPPGDPQRNLGLKPELPTRPLTARTRIVFTRPDAPTREILLEREGARVVSVLMRDALGKWARGPVADGDNATFASNESYDTVLGMTVSGLLLVSDSQDHIDENGDHWVVTGSPLVAEIVHKNGVLVSERHYDWTAITGGYQLTSQRAVLYETDGAFAYVYDSLHHHSAAGAVPDGEIANPPQGFWTYAAAHHCDLPPMFFYASSSSCWIQGGAVAWRTAVLIGGTKTFAATVSNPITAPAALWAGAMWAGQWTAWTGSLVALGLCLDERNRRPPPPDGGGEADV
jgi:hypothetical protein